MITQLQAQSPTKLLSPEVIGDFAQVSIGNYGGGLLAGDCVDLDCVIDDGARACVMTQASTKVYRNAHVAFALRTDFPRERVTSDFSTESVRSADPTNSIAQQNAQVRLGADSILLWIPDPVSCFADSSYRQHQTLDLHRSASLVLVDSFTSGRWSCGERWAMDSYCSHTKITVGGKLIFRDAIRLDRRDGPINATSRMGNWNCFSTLVIAGDMLKQAADEIVPRIGAQQLAPDKTLVYSGALAPWGMILRIAGDSAERAMTSIHQHLQPVLKLIDYDPWSRKF